MKDADATAPVPGAYQAIDRLVLAGPWPGGEDLDALHAAGVTILVNLTTRAYDDRRFTVHHLPVTDFTAPAFDQVEAICRLVERAEAAGDRVYVHCLAGCGRTGTMIACLLVARKGLDADTAITRVRRHRRGSIETDLQQAAVHAWEAHLRDGG